KFLIVGVCAAVVLAVRRLAVRGLSTLPVGLAILLRCSTADEALPGGRCTRIGRDCCGPGLAVPVPEETLATARIGIPPRVRAHGPSLCGQEGEGPDRQSHSLFRRTDS